MTKEDKELLLKDLCARLPYGICVKHKNYPDMELKLIAVFNDGRIGVECNGIGLTPTSINECKPYLRPMSSMTGEEFEEYGNITEHISIGSLDFNIANPNAIDWLNEHHFDYRGLIEKGLAIEVTKENNPYENGL